MTTSETVLMNAAWAPGRVSPVARAVLLSLAGSALIAICARIQVPMWPVPMTMQTFAVLLIGLAYGARLGAATVGLYLFEGGIGLPVFATGGGIIHLTGPTGGYLFGFVAAAALVGWLAHRGWSRPAWRVFLATLIGSATIYLFGAGWLAALIGPQKALAAGVLPFLLGDVLKAALAAALLPAAWRLVTRP